VPGRLATFLDDHLAFQRGVDAQGQPSELGASHVVFDGKNLGPGATPRLLPDGHIVFHRGTGWPRVIYDGSDLRPREQFDPATPTLHASLVVADREIGDDLLQLAVDAADLPDVLRVLGDVDLVVLGAVADLVHHEAELANADVLEVLAVLVEDFHMGSGHRVLDPLPRVLVLERTEQVSGDRDPDVAFAIHGGGAGGIEPGDEDLRLVPFGHDELAGLRLQRGARHPPARRARSCVLRERHGDQRQGGDGRQHEDPENSHRHSSSTVRGTAT